MVGFLAFNYYTNFGVVYFVMAWSVYLSLIIRLTSVQEDTLREGGRGGIVVARLSRAKTPSPLPYGFPLPISFPSPLSPPGKVCARRRYVYRRQSLVDKPYAIAGGRTL